MDFTFNFYALTLVFFGTVTLFLSYYIFKKQGGAVRFFAIMMLSNAIWSIAYGLELASSSIDQIKFFIDIEYIGIVTLPLNWFLFCLKLSGKENWYKKPLNMAFLLSVTIITILSVWTNDYHHLHYKSYHIDTSGEFPMIALEPGISYRLFTLYFYSLLALGSYLLLVKFRKADPIYKRQNYSIIIAATIPWIANITYIIGLRPLGNLDITPFAFITTILLISIAIYRFNLFDILPVAREKVLELMQDGFVVLDTANRVIDYNFAFKKYLPDHSEIIGNRIEKLLPGQKSFENFLKTHESGKIELTVETTNGPLDIEADIRYLNENQLNTETVIIKFQDLTTLRREATKSKLQAEELQQLNHLKDRIFSIIAHDLRGPLVNLSEVLKMISNNVITIDEFKSLLPTLSKDILYTTDLLENILHWSRSQLKGHGINKEFFDLKGLIVNEVNYHFPSAAVKKISIVQDVFPGEMVFADILMIQIVVRNIINNAIKFCNEGCEIHITSVYENNYIKLCIKDNGIGMSEDMVEKIFSGKNLSRRGTMNEKGTGLGLVVCRDFMERNDGSLQVESELGTGSSFYLYLPVDEKEEIVLSDAEIIST